jgi:hypothetical protein
MSLVQQRAKSRPAKTKPPFLCAVLERLGFCTQKPALEYADIELKTRTITGSGLRPLLGPQPHGAFARPMLQTGRLATATVSRGNVRSSIVCQSLHWPCANRRIQTQISKDGSSCEVGEAGSAQPKTSRQQPHIPASRHGSLSHGPNIND